MLNIVVMISPQRVISDAFLDADKMGVWAEPALAWANGNNLINGHDDGTLDPGGTTIRAQAASILMRFDLNIVKIAPMQF